MTFFLDDVFGKSVPYAYQKTVLLPDDYNEGTFWALNHITKKFYMITAEELAQSTQGAVIQIQSYRPPQFEPRQFYRVGAPTVVQEESGPAKGHTLEIYVPLSRLFEVRKTKQRLTDQDRAKAIRKQHPRRKSYYFSAALMNDDLYTIVRAEDPQADLVIVEGTRGKLAHREFLETAYWLINGAVITDWEIVERGHELLTLGKKQYVHMYDADITEVQLFEAWHDKRIRRYL